MKKTYLIILFILIVTGISFARGFLGLIGIVPWHYGYSDVFNGDRIDPSVAAKIPYVEKPIEYPVITGFFIYLMWFLGKNLLGYAILTYIFLSLFAAITGIFLYKLINLLKSNSSRVWLFFVFAPSMIIFSVYNWDIIAVMFMTLALYFFCRDKYEFAALFLSLGFNSKIFPILILPFMLLKVNIKHGIKIAAIFLSVFLVLNIYFMVHDFDLWKSTYTFHSSRAPNIDSIWSLAHLSTSTINILSLALFGGFYLLLIMHHKKYDILALSFISILLFLVFNKIFSPQYILWLLPFFVLNNDIDKIEHYSLEIVNLTVFFSTLYWIFVSKQKFFLALSNMSVIARSSVLVYIIYFVLKTYKKSNYNTENNKQI